MLLLVTYATFVCHCVPSELVSTLPALTHLAYHPFAFDGHMAVPRFFCLFRL